MIVNDPTAVALLYGEERSIRTHHMVRRCIRHGPRRDVPVLASLWLTSAPPRLPVSADGETL